MSSPPKNTSSVSSLSICDFVPTQKSEQVKSYCRTSLNINGTLVTRSLFPTFLRVQIYCVVCSKRTVSGITIKSRPEEDNIRCGAGRRDDCTRSNNDDRTGWVSVGPGASISGNCVEYYSVLEVRVNWIIS